MQVFLICPVRNVEEEENKTIESYVLELESKGVSVYWPKRDTDQNDPIGYQICEANFEAIRSSDEVHIWWNPTSQGTLFDLGMAFALNKKIHIVNSDSVSPTESKSFTNLLLFLDEIDFPK